jgi:hypothetical protein
MATVKIAGFVANIWLDIDHTDGLEGVTFLRQVEVCAIVHQYMEKVYKLC